MTNGKWKALKNGGKSKMSLEVQNKTWEEIEQLYQNLFRGINQKLGLMTKDARFKSCVHGDALPWEEVKGRFDEPKQFLPMRFIKGLAEGYISIEPNYDDLIENGFKHNGKQYMVVEVSVENE